MRMLNELKKIIGVKSVNIGKLKKSATRQKLRYHRQGHWVVICVFLALSLQGLSAEYRIWTSIKGTKVTAKYICIDGGYTILQMKNSDYIKIYTPSLILEDIRHITESEEPVEYDTSSLFKKQKMAMMYSNPRALYTGTGDSPYELHRKNVEAAHSFTNPIKAARHKNQDARHYSKYLAIQRINNDSNKRNVNIQQIESERKRQEIRAKKEELSQRARMLTAEIEGEVGYGYYGNTDYGSELGMRAECLMGEALELNDDASIAIIGTASSMLEEAEWARRNSNSHNNGLDNNFSDGWGGISTQIGNTQY